MGDPDGNVADVAEKAEEPGRCFDDETYVCVGAGSEEGEQEKREPKGEFSACSLRRVAVHGVILGGWA